MCFQRYKEKAIYLGRIRTQHAEFIFDVGNRYPTFTSNIHNDNMQTILSCVCERILVEDGGYVIFFFFSDPGL